MVQVLIAQDGSLGLQVLCNALTAQLHDVSCTAASALDALKLLGTKRHDVVLFDISGITELTALDVLRQVKHRWPHMALIVVQGAGQEAAIEMLRRYTWAIFDKPVDIPGIVAAVAAAVRRQDLQSPAESA